MDRHEVLILEELGWMVKRRADEKEKESPYVGRVRLEKWAAEDIGAAIADLVKERLDGDQD